MTILSVAHPIFWILLLYYFILFIAIFIIIKIYKAKEWSTDPKLIASIVLLFTVLFPTMILSSDNKYYNIRLEDWSIKQLRENYDIIHYNINTDTWLVKEKDNKGEK